MANDKYDHEIDTDTDIDIDVNEQNELDVIKNLGEMINVLNDKNGLKPLDGNEFSDSAKEE